jgi:hypothetical protein
MGLAHSSGRASVRIPGLLPRPQVEDTFRPYVLIISKNPVSCGEATHFQNIASKSRRSLPSLRLQSADFPQTGCIKKFESAQHVDKEVVVVVFVVVAN